MRNAQVQVWRWNFTENRIQNIKIHIAFIKMIEKALFIIKPDGWNQREQIKIDISNHFELLETRLLQFCPDLLAKLYPSDVGQPHYSALIEYMLETQCELGIIEGD